MSMEFAAPHDKPDERQAELHQAGTHNEATGAFETGPQETVLSCSDRRATDIEPEARLAPPESVHRPRTTVRERAVRGEEPIHLRDEEGNRVACNATAQAYLKKRVVSTSNFWRQEILDNFKPQREGLNLERGDTFIRSLGLAATDVVLELPEDRQLELEKISPIGLDATLLNGQYKPLEDVAIIFRLPRFEELNGPEFTEFIRIHELAHSASSRVSTVHLEDKKITDVSTQVGYIHMLPDRRLEGCFFNEGVPEMIAGEYMTEVLGKPHGLLDLPEGTNIHGKGFGAGISIPSRYIILDTEGERVAIGSPAYAAAGIEELIARDPALRPALIGGLYDEEARREVAGRIDAIRPGLFQSLHQNPSINIRGSGFLTALNHIREVLQ